MNKSNTIQKFLSKLNKKKVIILLFVILLIFIILSKNYNKESFQDKQSEESVVISFINDGIDLKVTNDLKHIFVLRINAEKKFRTITKLLINNGIIDINKNIIDLGAWIGDNTIVWSKMINGTVYAIDPSQENIDIIHTLQKLNNINNIITIKKPISNKIEKVEIVGGDINHATFKSSDNGIDTETLDNLYNNNIINNIGFIHLDVEGFEYKVLEASHQIISTFRPIISTESHEGDEDVEPLIKKYGYKKYLINEICGSNPTCRNIFWIPNEITLPNEISRLLTIS
jgi:FkbM family methyltransferase